jgi:hypothetical protein
MAEDPFDPARRSIQKCFESQPVVVIGSGASVPYGLPGMGALGEQLVKRIVPEDSEKDIWAKICAKFSDSVGIESVLDELPPESPLLRKVIQETWKIVNSCDCKAFEDRVTVEIGRLLFRLAQTSGRRVDVVTTNYDRLVEYAAEGRGLSWFDGFGPGYRRTPWTDGLPVIRRSASSGVPAEKMVAIWKVHGSLDWFVDGSGHVFSIPLRTTLPNDCAPCIVTPGRIKYERTQYEPFRTVLSEADAAMKRAGGAFCVGYGFNDRHVQEKLRARRDVPNFSFVVVAMELTAAAKEFLLDGKCKSFVAIEAVMEGERETRKPAENRCRVYTPESRTGIEIERSIWYLNALFAEVL